MKCPHCGKKIPAGEKPPTPRERAFVAHYMTNGNNGREAARSAGYKCTSDASFDTTASRVLRRVQVQALIEQASLPTTDLVMQVLREVGLTASESHARVAASRVLARIQGMIAPTKHQHAHLHLHEPPPAPGTPEAAEHALRSVRALVRLLTPRQRSLLLGDLEASSAVPALPEVSQVRMDPRQEEGEAGGGAVSEAKPEGPS